PPRTGISPLSLHDALPISSVGAAEMRWKNINELMRWVTEMVKGDDEHEPLNLEQAVAKLCLRDMLSRQEEEEQGDQVQLMTLHADRKSTRLNSSHVKISYA